MAQDDRQKARRIFMEMADLPESDRAAALERTCGGDTNLRGEVEALLRANGQAGGFMASPTDRGPQRGYSRVGVGAGDKGEGSMLSMHFGAPGLGEAVPSEQPGRLIGPYKLLELIGEGGFGTELHPSADHSVEKLRSPSWTRYFPSMAVITATAFGFPSVPMPARGNRGGLPTPWAHRDALRLC
jgi:hypothetical protein